LGNKKASKVSTNIQMASIEEMTSALLAMKIIENENLKMEIASLRAQLASVVVVPKVRKTSAKVKKIPEVIDILDEKAIKLAQIRSNNGNRLVAFNKAKKDTFNEFLNCAQLEW